MDLTPSEQVPPAALIIRDFTIKPSQGIKVELGTFGRDEPRPEFNVHVHDETRLESPGALVYSDISLPKGDGTYRLVRHFQSYSQTTHTVTVGFASAADKRLRIR